MKSWKKGFVFTVVRIKHTRLLEETVLYIINGIILMGGFVLNVIPDYLTVRNGVQ